MQAKKKKLIKNKAIVRRRRHHALTKKEPPTVAQAIENVLIKGDLTELTPEQRLEYYKALCKSLGLNPLTRPFEYILFRDKRDDDDDQQNAPGGKLTLYANKSCAEQLRQIHKVAVIPQSKKRVITDDFATTELAVVDKTGRTDTGIGIVYLKKYKRSGSSGSYVRMVGQNLGNAIMKSETKAKRRATLSICGLSMLDETELDTVEVIGGVTKEGRIWQYAQLPEEAGTRAPDAQDAIDGLRKRGLWCDEHNCARSTKHLEICESSRKEMPKASSSPQQAPDKPAAPSGAASSNPPTQPPQADKGEILVDWKMDAKEPILTGPLMELGVFLAKATPPIKLDFRDDGFWHAPAALIPAITKVATDNGFTVKDFRPPKTSSAQAKPEAKGTKPATKSKATETPTEPTVIAGTIERLNMGMAGQSPVKMITLVLPGGKKQMVGCFHKSMWDELEKGLGQFAAFRVETKGNYINIAKLGLIKIGAMEWDEHGTPAIQRKDQVAGQRTLY